MKQINIILIILKFDYCISFFFRMSDFNQDKLDIYLGQIKNNPYIFELRENIYETRRNILKNRWNTDFNLTDIQISLIFNCINKEDDFDLIKNNINELILDDFIKNVKLLVNKNFDFKPSEIRISTMTICCFLNVNINTKQIFDDFEAPEINEYETVDNIITGVKIKGQIKGYFPKKQDSGKVFFNSITLNVVQLQKSINLKIFNNGKIQMTGVISKEHSILAINMIINLLNTSKSTYINDVDKQIEISEFKTVLINSDYDCGFEIQRENLLKILVNEYNLSVNYEPENYPGVKVAFFWNNIYKDDVPGLCKCDKRCVGKGKGNGINECKKVTIAIFQSGKIIITGGNDLLQIQTVYEFLNGIFRKHLFEIKKKYLINYHPEIKITQNLRQRHRYSYIQKNKIVNIDYYNTLIKSL